MTQLPEQAGSSPVPQGAAPAVPDPGARSTALRVTVAPEGQLAVDLVPQADLHRAARQSVHALPLSAEDRAAGRRRYEAFVDGWRFELTVEAAHRAALRERVRRGLDGEGGSGPQVIRAQIPGRIVQVWVTAGADVEAGAHLCSLEAMKMENEIRAPRAGTIARVMVEPGSRVELGDELVVIE